MPNRILREGILTSERVERLNWAEEVFYRRLMSVVDDFGRYYARPSLVRSACYPLLLDKVSDSDVEKWLTACVEAALVRVYPAEDGKRYLMLRDFKQQVRATASKFPAPDGECVADAVQVPCKCKASAHLGVDGVGDEDGGLREGATPPPVDNFPSEWKAFCERERPDIDPLQTFEKFRNFYPDGSASTSMPHWEKWVKGERKKPPAKADIARVTVPGKPGRDPALIKVEEDAKRATKPPPEVRRAMTQLTGKALN